ncbi:transposase [Nonomuraea turcica]|uniref:transposase n=1 Tax=Nonomuraea sp. G32 TaxID=3067274 RepID=UPI00273AE772|nr:transposase [Nonomuraea sp. G32]MDP4506743.1 transposase [Nonomuraea sp. G32]
MGAQHRERSGADGRAQHRERSFLWDGHFWSRSYSAGSTGDASLATVHTYIQSQDRPQK